MRSAAIFGAVLAVGTAVILVTCMMGGGAVRPRRLPAGSPPSGTAGIESDRSEVGATASQQNVLGKLSEMGGDQSDSGDVVDAIFKTLAECTGDRPRLASIDLKSDEALRLLKALLDVRDWNRCQQTAVKELVSAANASQLSDAELCALAQGLGQEIPAVLQIAEPISPVELELLARLLEIAVTDESAAQQIVAMIFSNSNDVRGLQALHGFCQRSDSESTLDPESLAETNTCSMVAIGIWKCSSPNPEWFSSARAAILQEDSRGVRTAGFLAMRMLARYNEDLRAIGCLQESMDRALTEIETQPVGPLSSSTAAAATLAIKEIGVDAYLVRRLESLYGHPDPSVRMTILSSAANLIPDLDEEQRKGRVAQLRYAIDIEQDPGAWNVAIGALIRIDPDWAEYARDLSRRPLEARSRKTLDEALKKEKYLDAQMGR